MKTHNRPNVSDIPDLCKLDKKYTIMSLCRLDVIQYCNDSLELADWIKGTMKKQGVYSMLI